MSATELSLLSLVPLAGAALTLGVLRAWFGPEWLS